MLEMLDQLIIYRVDDTHLLSRLANALHAQKYDSNDRPGQFYTWLKELLDQATRCGWKHNLWHCLLTDRLLSDENSYTLSKERRDEPLHGSITPLLLHDMKLFQALFHYDWNQTHMSAQAKEYFTLICDYTAIPKRDEMSDWQMGSRIGTIAKRLANAATPQDMLMILDDFYSQYGVGKFAFHQSFRLEQRKDTYALVAIQNPSSTTLEDLIGYESQKETLCANTEAFLQGKNANNVLLYGESGTGKSSSIKAIANRYYAQGLRLIEIQKHQFSYLPQLIAEIKTRNYGFILYMDDLSFEEDETQYKYLKAIMEGGLEQRPKHVLIYATSNRRHLIKETWRDRRDIDEAQDLHLPETMSEKLSLVARFGVSIYYGRPTPQEYHHIVQMLAQKEGLADLDEQTLWQIANAWELRHGGVSGRCARQLIDDLNVKGHET